MIHMNIACEILHIGSIKIEKSILDLYNNLQ